MKKQFNILITSAGRRTKLLEYFKYELAGFGNLIAADCSILAPALYVADEHYTVPRIDHPNYIKEIKEICKKENITALFSLIDPELSLLGRYAEEFKQMGVTVVGSSEEICELWFDKYKAYTFLLKHGFPCAKTYISFSDFEDALVKHEVDFPVFIKPRRGSASLNISLARNLDEAKFLFQSSNDLIIQEFLEGQELGVDAYVDLHSGQTVSIFIKEKTAMRAGETDKARSIKSEELFQLIEQLMIKASLVGPIDVDVFEVKGKYYISEINPRFGGGYPLAYECGVNFPKMIINNLQGKVNKSNIGAYKENIIMMKHDTVTISSNIRINEIIHVK